jgi:5-methylcytosine-specific restriction enzyme A
MLRQDTARLFKVMGKTKRQHKAEWKKTRKRIWERDQGKCQGPYCIDTLPYSLPLWQADIDHIVELSNGGSNRDRNLRVLCRRCHVLRASHAHQGMISRALKQGLIPADWRPLVWE